MDALSLEACGVGGVAIVTTVMPHWLAPALAFRRVYVGLDGDGEGDKHAEALLAELAPFARTVERLRPPPCTLPNGKPGKDWNDCWQSVDVDLRRWLEEHLR